VRLGALLLGGTLLVGCGGAAAQPERLEATGAWARPTPAGSTAGVVYLTVSTDREDAIVAAHVPASVAEAVELHETTGGGGGGAHQHGAVGGSDTVSMGQVERFELEPGAPLAFAPGGNHVMLVGLVEPLERGDAFELTLDLESGRSITVDVPVQANPPG
jgi:copper(I)-binding protein